MINPCLITINLGISGYQRMHLYQNCGMDRYFGGWIAKPNSQQFYLNPPESCQFISAAPSLMIDFRLVTINLCILGYQRMHLYQNYGIDRYLGVLIAKLNPLQFYLNPPESC